MLARTEDLFLDWLGSARPAPARNRFRCSSVTRAEDGSGRRAARILVNSQMSAYFAALVNAASSHLVEQDDLHNSSVLHPATVVFPAALAAAQDLGKSGRELLVASVAGYEAASASASSSAARITASSTPPRRSAPGRGGGRWQADGFRPAAVHPSARQRRYASGGAVGVSP